MKFQNEAARRHLGSILFSWNVERGIRFPTAWRDVPAAGGSQTFSTLSAYVRQRSCSRCCSEVDVIERLDRSGTRQNRTFARASGIRCHVACQSLFEAPSSESVCIMKPRPFGKLGKGEPLAALAAAFLNGTRWTLRRLYTSCSSGGLTFRNMASSRRS